MENMNDERCFKKQLISWRSGTTAPISLIVILAIMVVCGVLMFCFLPKNQEFIGSTEYVEVINNNVPELEKTTEEFETYSDLDYLGRCGVAYANVSKATMPTTKRESIGMIKPSGWHTVKYPDLIEGNYLYNRCHLIKQQQKSH